MALKAILALPRFGVMLFAALLLIGGAMDAAACIPETDHHAAHSDGATNAGIAGAYAHAAASDAPSDNDKSGDQHAVCAHGHCHHSAASLLGALSQPELPALPQIALAASVPALISAPLAPPTQPPRA